MNRRDFLGSIAATAVGGFAWANELPKDVKITKIVRFDVVSKRNKVAGKNARLDVHGDTGTDRMVRLYTNHDIDGVGNCRADEKTLGKLLGKNPFDFFDAENRRFAAPVGPGTMPLWDLAGKFLRKPVYELLGGAGPERVPCYDGSIYFADLLPQFASRPLDRFKEEIDMGLERGHRAFKVKIGRGSKWMPRKEGDTRDIAVLQTIRKHAGPEILIGVDANNGYDLNGTKRFLDAVGDLNLAFIEEMFPEVVDECLELKRYIAERGWKTRIADGETQGELEVFKPFIAAKAIEIFQGDMNRFGFEGILTEAEWCRPQGLLVAPHNWGSLVGFTMQLHVGRAITNFYRAENDPLKTDVLLADGYDLKDGMCSVPATPGVGIRIDEAAFAREAKVQFVLTA